jgi:heavy metal translocating P-type ATPase
MVCRTGLRRMNGRTSGIRLCPQLEPHIPRMMSSAGVSAGSSLWPKAQVLSPAVVVGVPAAGLLVGIAIRFSAISHWSGWIFSAATVPVLFVLLAEIVAGLRHGRVGIDILAAMSMAAALLFGEHLAAVIVALMYAGGQYLENFAERRAGREMTALLARVPRTAMRYRDDRLEEIELETVRPGDRLLVRQGDVVPVDGVIASGIAVLDESALTGESLPIQYRNGNEIISGATNVGAAFDMAASKNAGHSTYAGIIRLVETARSSRAPMSRLADRFAFAFLFVAVLSAMAAWLWSGDPIRAVAVLVIATPCPLIIAVPVAIVSGLSRAAVHGILVKGGQALETLARVRSLVIDKTGTLTHGTAKIVSISPVPDLTPNELLRLAASLDQASQHIIAKTLVDEARSRGLALTPPTSVSETPGEGIEGRVDGRRVAVGGVRFIAARSASEAARSLASQKAPGSVIVAVAVDGRFAGTLTLADELRAGTETLLRGLRRLGIDRIVLATGDRREVANSVSAGLSIDSVQADLTPEQKSIVVLSERKNGPVMMIGDGVNDAPALAAADVGLAMGAEGAAASAEAADIVLLVDQLDRVLTAIRVARRSRVIALQSVYAGMSLSIAGMIAAAAGFITPVQGALAQEIIDVAVILNALRALHDPP